MREKRLHTHTHNISKQWRTTRNKGFTSSMLARETKNLRILLLFVVCAMQKTKKKTLTEANEMESVLCCDVPTHLVGRFKYKTISFVVASDVRPPHIVALSAHAHMQCSLHF